MKLDEINAANMINYQNVQEKNVDELNIKTEFDNENKRKTFSERQRINPDDPEAMELVYINKFYFIYNKF